MVGIALKAFGKAAHPLLSVSIYLGMGWLVVVAVPMAKSIAPTGELFVIAGTACHYFAVLWYAA